MGGRRVHTSSTEAKLQVPGKTELQRGSFPNVCSTTAIMDDSCTLPDQAAPGTGSDAAGVSPQASQPSTASAGNSNTDPNLNGPLTLRPGHELPFVAPSSYLRPKPSSRTMSDKTSNPLDKDQMQGLVSIPFPRQHTHIIPYHQSILP